MTVSECFLHTRSCLEGSKPILVTMSPTLQMRQLRLSQVTQLAGGVTARSTGKCQPVMPFPLASVFPLYRKREVTAPPSFLETDDHEGPGTPAAASPSSTPATSVAPSASLNAACRVRLEPLPTHHWTERSKGVPAP